MIAADRWLLELSFRSALWNLPCSCRSHLCRCRGTELPAQTTCLSTCCL